MWRHPDGLHDQPHLLLFILAWKEWIPDIQFGNNAGKTPYVDFEVVGYTKDDFRSSVVTTLDVGIDALADEATRAEVDNLEPGFVGLH